MKIKTIIFINETKKFKADSLKKLTDKSSFDEAIKRTAGIGKGKVVNVREKLNSDLLRRSKRE